MTTKLKGKLFHEIISSALSNEFDSVSSTDVTLVSDDKIPFQAHKFILSACSPMMKDLMMDNPNSHPIIFLRGIKQEELRTILEFIYHGTVRISQDKMEEFLDTAKKFDLEHLSEALETVNSALNTEEKGSTEFKNAGIEHQKTNSTTNVDNTLRCTEESLSIRIELEEPSSFTIVGKVMQFKRQYKCNECEVVYNRSDTLFRHKKNKHEGVRYSCDQCVMSFCKMNSLRNHRKAIHEGIRYYCHICDSSYTQKNDLNRHIKSKHSSSTDL